MRTLLKPARAVAPVFLAGWRDGLNWLLPLAAAWAVTLCLAVRWDGTAGLVRLFGLPINGTGGSREAGLTVFLSEWASLAWLAAACAYLLPSVLMPLASSFSVSNTLWLRLAPCDGRHLWAARACRVLLGAAALAAAGAAAGVLWAAVHRVPPGPLLLTAAGVAGHALVAGGLVMLWAPLARGEAGRALVASLAAAWPVMSWLLFEQLGSAASYWPIACPFAQEMRHAGRHFAAALAAGAGLLMVSLVLHRGRPVESPVKEEVCDGVA